MIKKPVFVCLILLLLLAAGCYRVPAPPAGFDRDWGERQIFDYHGVKINYYEKGQGSPVLLLHGFGASAYTWRFIGPPLAADHRVFTMDLKGYGLSDKPGDGKYAVSDQADMVADFIRTRDLHDLTIMGHSMGGGVALMTYFKVREDQPPRLKALVLIDSAGYPQKMPWFIRLSRIPGLTSVGGRLISPRLATALVLRKCFYNREKITEEEINTYAYFGSLPGARAAVIETGKQIVPAEIEALTKEYKTISVPTLVIWGAEDDVVPLSVGRQFKRDIPNCELAVLPRCGHVPLEEEPQKTSEIIASFLAKR